VCRGYAAEGAQPRDGRDSMVRETERRMKRLSPEKLKRRRMAYMRAHLRPDTQPADPAVIRIFHRIEWERSDPCAVRAEWDNLLHYLATLEEHR
jgi:hypothetical protein